MMSNHYPPSAGDLTISVNKGSRIDLIKLNKTQLSPDQLILLCTLIFHSTIIIEFFQLLLLLTLSVTPADLQGVQALD